MRRSEADFDLATMPVECAFPIVMRYEKNNNKVSKNQNNNLGTAASVPNRSNSGKSAELEELTLKAKCKKRNKVAVVDESEVEAKKMKFNDIPVQKSLGSRKFKNSRMKIYKKNWAITYQTGDEETAGPSTSSAPVPIRNKRKRKVAKPKPKQVSKELMDITDVTNNDRKDAIQSDIPLKKRIYTKKQTKLEDNELGSKIRKDVGSVAEEDLMFALEHLHIEPDLNRQKYLCDTMILPKKRQEKNNKKQTVNKSPNQADINSNTLDLKKLANWTRKRWNKEQKKATEAKSLDSFVVVHNLPNMTLVNCCVLRQQLIGIFGKYGHITDIGPAIAHPTLDNNSAFSTTIHFDDATAATKALEEDNSRFGGSVIRVVRPLVSDPVRLPVELEQILDEDWSPNGLRRVVLQRKNWNLRKKKMGEENTRALAFLASTCKAGKRGPVWRRRKPLPIQRLNITKNTAGKT